MTAQKVTNLKIVHIEIYPLELTKFFTSERIASFQNYFFFFPVWVCVLLQSQAPFPPHHWFAHSLTWWVNASRIGASEGLRELLLPNELVILTGSAQTTPQVKGGLSFMLSRTLKGCVRWYLLQKGLRESCLGIDRLDCVSKRNAICSYCKGRTAYWGTRENTQDSPWLGVNAKTPCHVCFQQEASGHLWVWVSTLEGENF